MPEAACKGVSAEITPIQIDTGACQMMSQTIPAANPASRLSRVSGRKRTSTTAARKTTPAATYAVSPLPGMCVQPLDSALAAG